MSITPESSYTIVMEFIPNNPLDLSVFEERINELLVRGWDLHGSQSMSTISTVGIYISQALFRKTTFITDPENDL